VLLWVFLLGFLIVFFLQVMILLNRNDRLRFLIVKLLLL
jgi:hypothetical protein